MENLGAGLGKQGIREKKSGPVNGNTCIRSNEKVGGLWYPIRRESCQRMRSAFPRAGLGQSPRPAGFPAINSATPHPRGTRGERVRPRVGKAKHVQEDWSLLCRWHGPDPGGFKDQESLAPGPQVYIVRPGTFFASQVKL